MKILFAYNRDSTWAGDDILILKKCFESYNEGLEQYTRLNLEKWRK